MSHTYPRIDRPRYNNSWARLAAQDKGMRCTACDNRAIYRVDVEVNWFRGDDEVCRACETHKNDATALLAGAERKRNGDEP